MFWNKPVKEKPTITMICISHCAQCQAPIYGPSALEVPRDIPTQELMAELSAKVVNFCVCRPMESMFGMDKSPIEGN